MRILIFLLTWLALSPLSAASHSGQYHPATEAAALMMTPTMGHPGFAVADTTALQKFSQSVRSRTRLAWLGFTVNLFAIPLFILFSGISSTLLLIGFALIIFMTMVLFTNLLGALYSLMRLDIALEGATVAQRIFYRSQVATARLSLKVMLFLLTLGLLRLLLMTIQP